MTSTSPYPDPHALARAIVMRAAKAKKDVHSFFDFVMREENTQVRIKEQAHQRLIIDFIMAHPRCCIMMPVGAAKTYTAAAITLRFLGEDPTTRGAIVSATETQAKKPLHMVRDYIEQSQELRLVYPNLVKNPKGPWLDTAIQVKRPPGIRDASLAAYGLDTGSILGSRLNWIILDDVLTDENTKTNDQRVKVINTISNSVLSRLDPTPQTRCVFFNSPWHPKDAMHQFRDGHGGIEPWPTLRVDIEGNIEITGTDWDSDLIRPRAPNDPICRFIEHDKPEWQKYARKGVVPLWPERYPWDWIDMKRRTTLPKVYNQTMLCLTRDDDTAQCKQEWIDECKKKGRGLTMVSTYIGKGHPTFTGLDLAVGKGEENDDTCFFTFAILPTGLRLILDIEIGKFDGPTIVKKIAKKIRAYDSILKVENNACFAKGSQVLTRDQGFKAIEEIRPGEFVWTHMARWREVLEIKSSRERMMTTARPKGGLPIRCTPNHLFWMRNRDGYKPVGEPQWVSNGFSNVDKPYVAVAIPKWPTSEAVIDIGSTRKRKGRTIHVDEELALGLGLYMAEGHSTKGQSFWTLNFHEDHLAELAKRTARTLDANAKIGMTYGDGTQRVVMSSCGVAAQLGRFGKRDTKAPPIEWYGWPLAIRLAMVRGWLLGDGSLYVNNRETCPRQGFVASSISKNWMLFARSTLFELGLRPTLVEIPIRESSINGRKINRRSGFKLALNSDDSTELQSHMVSLPERLHWKKIPSGQRSGSTIVIDGLHAWARVDHSTPMGGPFEHSEEEVYDLVVDEDHSYTVDYIISHNAQDYIRQFALNDDAALAVTAHTTGRAKADPTYGVQSLFIEIANGAWIIPCNQHGQVHPNIQRWIDGCLYYTPAAHTDDSLMACYFAREQAREFGYASGGTLAAQMPAQNALDSGFLNTLSR